MTLVRKLLRQHISVGQLAGFCFANFVGMVIIMTAIQIRTDVKPLFEENDGLTGKDYMVITKPLKSMSFDEEEIQALQSQTFATDVGRFVSAQFRVYADVTLGRNSVGTYMFFESVPDKFIDVDLEKWRYDEEKRIIPIIIPRNYLNLYNLGFARSQGLPQLPEDIIRNIPLNLYLGDRPFRQEFTGYVVGFSHRLNTILVPYDFMMWANETFASDKQPPMLRLIVETENQSDESINVYFNQHGYEVEGNNAENSKGRFIVKVLISILLAIGGIICLLSVYILTLSIYLLLHKNAAKLETLLNLGYTPAMVSRPYVQLTALLNSLVFVLSISVAFILRNVYVEILSEAFVIVRSDYTAMICFGVLLCIATVIFDRFIIRRYINRIAVRTRKHSPLAEV